MSVPPNPYRASRTAGSDGYKVFGLTVRSEIELPELDQASAVGEADVVIKVRQLPPMKGEQKNLLVVTEDGAILNIPGAGRYLLREGREITVDPDPAGSERHLRLYLLGSAFGAILHQRGLLPLHSNVMELGERAVAFMGASGAGKSTMAAWFHDRGYNVLADDVCVVTLGQERPLAHPGIPRLRLWRDALESSGRNPSDHEHAFDDADKYNVRTRPDDQKSAAPLGAIYLLNEPNPNVGSQAITRLVGVDALEALISNTYRGAYIPLLGETERHLFQCIELARQVPVFKLDRVWGFDAFEEQARLVEQHARALP